MYNEKFRLNRFFNIFNPNVLKAIAYYNVISLILLIFFALTDGNIIVWLFCIILINTVTVSDLVLHCPKEILFRGNYATFNDYVHMPKKHVHRRGITWLRVTYYVTEIKDVRFHQNAFEKLFNVGHISFSGKAEFEAKRDVDRIKSKEYFTIYGLKNFSRFKSGFENNSDR